MEKIKEGESQKREDVLLPMYKKNVSTLGKIKCSQKSVYSCILPFMFLGLRNTCRFGPLTFFALLTLFALLLSVHQWLRSAIRDSQQPTSPIGFLFLKKVTLDAKHNLNARFINNMEKVLLMLNTT